jgi:hypothetical protein
MSFEEYCTYELIKRRAAFGVYMKFNINRFELSYLLQLCAFLQFHDKQVIGKTTFERQVTSNSREKAKMQGYLKGNLDKGFIGTFEYKSKPGTTSLGITDLGIAVIKKNMQDIAIYMERFKPAIKKQAIAA